MTATLAPPRRPRHSELLRSRRPAKLKQSLPGPAGVYRLQSSAVRPLGPTTIQAAPQRDRNDNSRSIDSAGRVFDPPQAGACGARHRGRRLVRLARLLSDGAARCRRRDRTGGSALARRRGGVLRAGDCAARAALALPARPSRAPALRRVRARADRRPRRQRPDARAAGRAVPRRILQAQLWRGARLEHELGHDRTHARPDDRGRVPVGGPVSVGHARRQDADCAVLDRQRAVHAALREPRGSRMARAAALGAALALCAPSPRDDRPGRTGDGQERLPDRRRRHPAGPCARGRGARGRAARNSASR